MNKFFLTTIAAFLIAPFQLFAGAEGKGGGDMCESRIKTIRDDIENWILAGGPNGLDLKGRLTIQDYSRKMLEQIAKAKIKCVNPGDEGYPVLIGETPKTCRFDRSPDLSQITCDTHKFGALSGSDQYVITHHEYAGLGEIEIPNEDSSDYTFSNQITDYLDDVLVKRLSIVKKEKEDEALTRSKDPSIRSFKLNVAWGAQSIDKFLKDHDIDDLNAASASAISASHSFNSYLWQFSKDELSNLPKKMQDSVIGISFALGVTKKAFEEAKKAYESNQDRIVTARAKTARAVLNGFRMYYAGLDSLVNGDYLSTPKNHSNQNDSSTDPIQKKPATRTFERTERLGWPVLGCEKLQYEEVEKLASQNAVADCYSAGFTSCQVVATSHYEQYVDNSHLDRRFYHSYANICWGRAVVRGTKVEN